MGRSFYFITAREGTVYFTVAGSLDDVTWDCFYSCCVSTLMSSLNSHNNPLLFFLPFGKEGGNQALERGSDLFSVTQ